MMVQIRVAAVEGVRKGQILGTVEVETAWFPDSLDVQYEMIRAVKEDPGIRAEHFEGQVVISCSEEAVDQVIFEGQ